MQTQVGFISSSLFPAFSFFLSSDYLKRWCWYSPSLSLSKYPYSYTFFASVNGFKRKTKKWVKDGCSSSKQTVAKNLACYRTRTLTHERKLTSLLTFFFFFFLLLLSLIYLSIYLSACLCVLSRCQVTYLLPYTFYIVFEGASSPTNMISWQEVTTLRERPPLYSFEEALVNFEGEATNERLYCCGIHNGALIKRYDDED